MLFCRPGVDPFDEPECEAYDLFVNEFQCVGKGILFYNCCIKLYDTSFFFLSSFSSLPSYISKLFRAGCPYSCVKRAPHAFSFSLDYATAHVISQGLL